jgi:hypothetical protein
MELNADEITLQEAKRIRSQAREVLEEKLINP